MAGETDLSILIRNMTPELQNGTFVFVEKKDAHRAIEILDNLSKNYKQ